MKKLSRTTRSNCQKSIPKSWQAPIQDKNLTKVRDSLRKILNPLKFKPQECKLLHPRLPLISLLRAVINLPRVVIKVVTMIRRVLDIEESTILEIDADMITITSEITVEETMTPHCMFL
jgi:hypothetical protein